MSIIVKGGSAAVKKAKSYYDKLKRAQAKRDKEIKEKTPSSARRDMKDKPKAKDERSYLQRLKDVNRNTQRVSDREKRRRDRTGSSGLKVGTEEALGKGAIGLLGGALGTGLIGAGIATDRAAKERGRKHKERFRKMKKFARKAESEGKKTFTYEGKKYDVEPRYSSGMIGSGEVRTYYVPVKPKPKKPVKKSTGGIIKASKTITKKKTASRNKKGMGTKWESRWG
jgi:hypothetical protein